MKMSNRLPYAGYVSYIVREMTPEEAQVVRRQYFSLKTKPMKWPEYVAYCQDNGYKPDDPDFTIEQPKPLWMKIGAALLLPVLWFIAFMMAVMVESVKRGKYY
jgi:hypothetical protein